MDLMELIFILLGAAICVYYGWKLLLFSRMLFPKRCFPLSETFFTSMGDWAVVTGASEGIGRAYAFALAERGMNVVIMSRTKATLDLLAKEIGEATGQKVKVIVADFSCDNTFREIEEQLMDLNIGVLVNNVGVLPSIIPCKFLDTEKLEKTITMVINCNVKTMMKMCKVVLPDMEKRRKGLIVNISSGISTFPFPLYTLYAASKVFVERFSRCLQAEYESKGIIIQAVVPFGVSTRMAGYQKTNMVTLSPEDFVKTSMQYLRAGDKTHGSICHTALGWLMQCIPLKVLHSEFLLQHMQYYVKKKMTKKQLMSAKTAPSENRKH
ncbi:17-beta-hydroxysteroid dehydrogenase type 3 [Nothobranchius furzeri]|uniref:Hydroxysteroid (17-beta) dehydrogenase 3 n=1 Tax=Nothobranchius furzeri TaxID=105023 RepID=A0A1A8AFT7_NOTFU|nr:17-beta-hydroxysteroid dehydrogenase type 3 [Nothobranchius furzeri]KAF7200499.1 hydroxysteroid (17-beta) dehydrogenase 3 [Nothobranchius furzeri]